MRAYAGAVLHFFVYDNIRFYENWAYASYLQSHNARAAAYTHCVRKTVACYKILICTAFRCEVLGCTTRCYRGWR